MAEKNSKMAGIFGLMLKMGWEVWAADGHKIEHATHDSRNAKDQYAY